MKNENLELIQQEPLPVARPQVVNIEDLFRYAIEKGGGVDTMERLMAVRRELNAEQAKRAFDDAMASFQAECPPIAKTKNVKTDAGALAYSYAPFESIIVIVKPCLQKHGFSFTLDTDTESKDGWVIAKCKVTHSGGHSVESTAKFPLGAGTRIMSATQVYAAALTFASRRVFCNAFGIVCGQEDQDGQGEKDKAKGPSSQRDDKGSKLDGKALKEKLWELLKPVRGLERNWDTAHQWLSEQCQVDEFVSEMTPARLSEVISKAETQLGGEK